MDSLSLSSCLKAASIVPCASTWDLFWVMCHILLEYVVFVQLGWNLPALQMNFYMGTKVDNSYIHNLYYRSTHIHHDVHQRGDPSWCILCQVNVHSGLGSIVSRRMSFSTSSLPELGLGCVSCNVAGAGFLFRILWCSQSGNHSQNNLAKFGCIVDMKVGKNPNASIFLATCWNLSLKSGNLWKQSSKSGEFGSFFPWSFV